MILFDKNWGLMREILASPMNRNHIIFGIGLSGVTKSFIQAIIIMVFGILIGAAFFAGFTAVEIVIGILGILAFVGMFALGFLFLSAAIAISMESPEGLQGVSTLLTMPIFFASNALYPIDTFPEFLKILSVYNPDDAAHHRYPVFCHRPGFHCSWETLPVHAVGYTRCISRAYGVYRAHVRACLVAV